MDQNVIVLSCPEEGCAAKFTRKYNLNRHFRKYHGGNPIVEKCFLCGQIFRTCEELNKHFQRNHKPTRQFVLVESAFKKAITNFRYTFPEFSELNFSQSQLNIKNLIKDKIIFEASKKTICKVSLVFTAQMSMLDLTGDKIHTSYIPFRAPAFHATASNSGSITKNITASFNHQAEALDNFINAGSNWHFDRPFVFNIEISSLRPVVSGQDFNLGDDDLNISAIKNNSELFNPLGTKTNVFFIVLPKHFMVKTKKQVVRKQQKSFSKNM